MAQQIYAFNNLPNEIVSNIGKFMTKYQCRLFSIANKLYKAIFGEFIVNYYKIYDDTTMIANLFAAEIIYGRFPIPIHYFSNTTTLLKTMCIETGRMHDVLFGIDKGVFKIDQSDCIVMAQRGHFDLLRRLRKMRMTNDLQIALGAALTDKIKILQWVMHKNESLDLTNVISVATQNFSMRSLIWIRKNTREFADKPVCKWFAKNGKFDEYKVLVGMNLPEKYKKFDHLWKPFSHKCSSIYCALAGGHIEIAQWLISSFNFKITIRSCSCAAARDRSMKSLEFLRARNKIDYDIIQLVAVRIDSIAVLEWCRQYTSYINPYAYEYAIIGGHVECVKWIENAQRIEANPSNLILTGAINGLLHFRENEHQ